MKLHPIVSDTYSVYAVELEDADHDCAAFLGDQWAPPNQACRRARDSILAIIERLSKNPRLVEGMCHTIDDKIFQFSRGQYRVPWFYDRDRIVICTHYFIKQGPKTPKSEKDRAKSIKDNYINARDNGTIEWME